MKKNLFKKGVAMLGTISLLASIVLSCIQYAFADPVPVNLNWEYVHDQSTWESAYTREGSLLKMYYEDYPSEDLYCESANRAPSFNDRVYSAKLCSDSECIQSEDISLTTTWGEAYQIVNDGENSYYLAMSAEVGNDEIYELYELQTSCTIPVGAPNTAYFPNNPDNSSWADPESCAYAVPFEPTENLCILPSDAPNDAIVPEWWSTAPYCQYKAKAVPPQMIPSGKYVKLLSYSYPGCTQSYQGRSENGGVAWGVVEFPYAYTGRISIKYPNYNEGENVYVDGNRTRNIAEGKYFIFNIPEAIRDGFNKENLSIYLEWECEEGTHLDGNACVTEKLGACMMPEILDANANYQTEQSLYTREDNQWKAPVCEIVSCVDGYTFDSENKICKRNAVEEVKELVDIQDDTTATGFPVGVSNNIADIEVVNSGDEILTGAIDKVVLQQSNNPTDTVEGSQSVLQEKMSQDLGLSASKNLTILGVLNLKFINVPTSGILSTIGNAITFSKPVKIKFSTNKAVKIAVKHNGESSYSYDKLVNSKDANCANIADEHKYTGALVSPVGEFAELYTCGASTFVAYTESEKTTTISVGGGGGSSYSAPKKEETKVETGSNNEEINLGGEVKDESTTGEVSNEGNNSDVIISEAAKKLYDNEQIEAYKWAYKNGITTINDIDKARLSDPLTRAELAKMMSQYISSVLKKTPIKTDIPQYSDVDDSLGDLAGYIVKAYQYQIMGINADGSALEYFIPNGLVSRAEFATVFSRVLYGNKNNTEGEDFYSKHIEALKTAGILTNDNPTIQEVRGWVMLMMYRSAKTTEEAKPESPNEEAVATTGNTVTIANPASTYCVEQGGELTIKTADDGSQYGMCKLKDGSEVEEWEYFRANHKNEAATGAVAEALTGALAEAATGTTAEVTTGTTVEAATGATATTGAAE